MLAGPLTAEGIETLETYGTDTRYYVMIRGWLVQELDGQPNAAKAEFLRKAIRRIDLE